MSNKNFKIKNGLDVESIISASNINLLDEYPDISPSLNLDFANAQTLDPRITFTRSSTATYTGSDGLIEIASVDQPRFDYANTGECKGLLIEESRTNLLTYSEDFNNTNWSKSEASVIQNSTTSPDGTLTADKLVESSTTSWHYTNPSTVAISLATYTISIFVKAAERSVLQIIPNGSSFPTAYVNFDLASGIASASSGVDSYTITDIGNGWYKCTVVDTATVASTVTPFYLTIQNSTLAARTGSYLGDGTSGIYIWGAQLEAGSFPTSYIPSTDTFTSRASTATYIGSNGLIQSAAINTARYQYNPLNLGLAPKLLLESAANNIITYSEDFSNNNASNNVTISVNQIAAPDGNITADKITSTVTGGLNQCYVQKASSIANTANTTYIGSIFVKKGLSSNCLFNMQLSGGTYQQSVAILEFNTETLVTTDSIPQYMKLDKYPNDWYRISLSITNNGTNTNVAPRIYVRDQGSTNTIGDYLYIWGIQVETGSYPTSYIPTTTAAVSRSADVSSSAASTRSADLASMTGTNFSSWYNQTEGTIISKSYAVNYIGAAGVGNFASISDGTDKNFISTGRSHAGATNRFEGNIVTNSVNQMYVNPSSWEANALGSLALAYKLNDCAFSYNGTLLTDTSVSVPTTNRLYIGANMWGSSGYPNSCISKLVYYPERLSNAILQNLTK